MLCVAGIFPSILATLNDYQKSVLLTCRTECKSMLITLVFKMILLTVGTWAVFARRSRATMPRIFLFRAALLLLLFICCIAYWLFYIIQVTEGQYTILYITKLIYLLTEKIVAGARSTLAGVDKLEYRVLVSYVSSFVDTLLFILFVGVILIEIRHLQPRYYIKVHHFIYARLCWYRLFLKNFI